MDNNLTPQKLTDMWRAGYCRKTVEFAATTTNDYEGSQRRLWHLELHLPQCADCCYANALKEIEGQVASAIGPHAVELFKAGQDITKLPEFRTHFDPIMKMAHTAHPLFGTTAGKAWLTQQAKRASEDYVPTPNA